MQRVLQVLFLVLLSSEGVSSRSSGPRRADAAEQELLRKIAAKQARRQAIAEGRVNPAALRTEDEKDVSDLERIGGSQAKPPSSARPPNKMLMTAMAKGSSRHKGSNDNDVKDESLRTYMPSTMNDHAPFGETQHLIKSYLTRELRKGVQGDYKVSPFKGRVKEEAPLTGPIPNSFMGIYRAYGGNMPLSLVQLFNSNELTAQVSIMAPPTS